MHVAEILRKLRVLATTGPLHFTPEQLNKEWEILFTELDSWMTQGGSFPADWMEHDNARRAGLPAKKRSN